MNAILQPCAHETTTECESRTCSRSKIPAAKPRCTGLNLSETVFLLRSIPGSPSPQKTQHKQAHEPVAAAWKPLTMDQIATKAANPTRPDSSKTDPVYMIPYASKRHSPAKRTVPL
jgi:hypothetical protein